MGYQVKSDRRNSKEFSYSYLFTKSIILDGVDINDQSMTFRDNIWKGKIILKLKNFNILN